MRMVMVIMIAIGVFISLQARPSKVKQADIGNIQITSSVTPPQFSELTIPYLRSRNYDSSLGQLRQVSQNSSYTTYLTSFNSEGLNINGLLTIPNEGKKHPAIVFVHGYIPPTQYKTQEKYGAYVDYLARNGFVVFKIDLRGHGDSEGEPGGAYYSADYSIDTLSAYSALQKAEFVDPQRIGLWGHSMAGNVVMRSLAIKSRIPAVVIWAGAGFTYQDLKEYGLRDASYRPPAQDTKRQQRRKELFAAQGEFNPESPYWKQVVPTNYLTDFTGAIQLHHAVNDTVVSVEYSRNLSKILGETKIPHQLFEYPSGGHNISDPSFAIAMKRTVEFYVKYLHN